MQLLIILALLLYGGKSNVQNILTEVKPVLETIGGDDMKQALKSAEEISTVLNAVKDFTSSPAQNGDGGFTASGADGMRTDSPAIAFPLEPISKIADRQITYSLSEYVSQN